MFTIIIPTYNRNNSLNNCILSIKNNLDNSIDKIIVIDDGSKIPINETIDYYGIDKNKFKIIRTENKGQAAARNLGIKEAKSEYLIFIDDDCTLEKIFIKNLKIIIRNNQKLEVIESSFLDPYKNNYYNKTWHLTYLYNLNKSKDYKKEGKYVKFLGNCYIVKKSLFKRLGYFDERFRTREDSDFIVRLFDKNIPIVLFYKIKVKHFSRASFILLIKQFYRYGKSEFLLIKKWGRKLNKVFYHNNIIDILDYIRNYDEGINIWKIKYIMVAGYISSRLGMSLQSLKALNIKDSVRELINIIGHIKKVYLEI